MTLLVPGPPLDDAMAETIRRALANGTMGGIGLHTTDCQKIYEELSAKGVHFIQPAIRCRGRDARTEPGAGDI